MTEAESIKMKGRENLNLFSKVVHTTAAFPRQYLRDRRLSSYYTGDGILPLSSIEFNYYTASPTAFVAVEAGRPAHC